MHYIQYLIRLGGPLFALALVISNPVGVLANEITSIEALSTLSTAKKTGVSDKKIRLPTLALELGDEIVADDIQVLDLIAQATADEETDIDPTDPTNIVSSLTFSYERTEFSNSQGNSNLFAVEGWIPLSQRDLLTVEVKLVNINLADTANGTAQGSGLSFFDQSDSRGVNATNLGDTRLRYFHLIPVENGGLFRAWAPSLDTVIPTGNPNDGTGGDYWIVAPNAVLAFDLSERISLYTFFRYVQGFSTGSQPDIYGVNIEIPISYGFSEVTFLTVTPNFFHDFGQSDTTFLTTKVGLTQMFSDSVGGILETNLPIAGQSGIDYSIKASIFLYL